MRRFLFLLLIVLLTACAGYRTQATPSPTVETPPKESTTSIGPLVTKTPPPSPSAPPATPTALEEPPPSPTKGELVSISFPAVPDAQYGRQEDVQYVHIPIDPACANFTATPILVGEWLVYPGHVFRKCARNPGPYGRALFGYHLKTGQLYFLYQGASGEAPLTYDAETDTLYWTVTFGGSVLIFDPQTMALRRKMSVRATSDSAGTILEGLFYFGTINGPDKACQQPLNPNCGALFAIDPSGQVVHQRNYEDGFRAWIGTSVTTDGTYLYWGTAAQTVGQKTGDEPEYLYGCSVVKTDRELRILASFDPGDMACFALPFQGANMDSVSGEVVPDGRGVWVQYVRPNGPDMVSALYRLDTDLKEICRVTFPFEPQTQAVGFYAGPTVDAQGNAYVPVSVPDATAKRKAQLYRVTPDCEVTLLAERPGAFAHASPTLADDRYVLFATDGRLDILTFEGRLVKTYTLASEARVLASPVLHEGVLYVLQEDGTLNIIGNTGLLDYGNALWPRYRHDNAGTGVLR